MKFFKKKNTDPFNIDVEMDKFEVTINKLQRQVVRLEEAHQSILDFLESMEPNGSNYNVGEQELREATKQFLKELKKTV